MNAGSREGGVRHYALRDDRHCDVLAVGSNIIGRGPTDVEGLSFVGIESPRGAVSRMQATIEIALNGDAWVSDCGSTNGTYISVRPGTGLRLEPHRFYQLSEGCTLVFGDVERRFVSVGSAVAAAKATQSKSRAASVAKSTPEKSRRSTEALASSSGPAEVVAEEGASVAARGRETGPSDGTGGNGTDPSVPLRHVPYLADMDGAATGTGARKRQREADDAEAPGRTRAPPAAPKPAKGKATLSPSPMKPLVVCTSGLEPEEKAKARKSAKRHGATMTDDIAKATLLVVGSPSVRTPKFIIAVARCVPIVPMECLEQADALTHESVSKHIVPLVDNGRTYSAKTLTSAIYRGDTTPLLRGLCFSLHGLRGKGKQVAVDVITGCGGEVTKGKTGAGLVIDSEAALNDLYDRILRGVRP